MKFRIFYKDQYLTEKTMIYDCDNYWTILDSSKRIFGDKLLRVEEVESGSIVTDPSLEDDFYD